MKVGIYHIGDDRKFTPETLYKEPLGGAQTDTIHVANELSKYFDVIVMNPNDKDEWFGNVFYTNYDNLGVYYNDINVVIVTTAEVGVFHTYIDKIPKKIFWKHHQYPFEGEYKQSEMFKIIDACVCVSKHCMDAYSKYYESDKYYYIYNPVDMSGIPQYKTFDERENDMIYLSFPNRGLFSFTELLPSITNMIPNIKLHNYGNATIYGWSDRDILFKNMQGFKLLQSYPNFVQHDSIPYYELLKILGNTKLFTYPSNFDESFCCAMAMAMACGLPCIASRFGSLPSIFPDNEYFVDWPVAGNYDDEYFRAFTNSVVELYYDVNKWNIASKIAVERAKDFDSVKIGLQWKELIEGL